MDMNIDMISTYKYHSPLLFYGGVGRGATPCMTSTAVSEYCSKTKDAAVSGRSSRNSVVSMDDEELRNKFKYLEYKESDLHEQTRRMKESKRQLEMEQETLRRREQLCRETFDNHLQQMRQMQDLMLAETEKQMHEKWNKAEIEVDYSATD